MAWVFESIDKTFTNFQRITDEKKELICEQVSTVNKLIKYNELFTEFQRAYEEYLDIADDMVTNKSNALARYIKNYLASYKSYIDGMETLLSRSFNKETYKSFKDLQRKVYDENFNYRFIYNLRNYAQHCGSPISSIKRAINQETKINLKVDKFLSEHTGMQPSFRKELKNYKSDIIDIGAAIKSVHKAIIAMQNSIFNLMINNDKDDILQSAYELVQFYNDNSKSEGTLYISNDNEVYDLKSLQKAEPEEVKMCITQIPHSLATFILKNIFIKYMFKGKNIGRSKTFPLAHKTQSVVEKQKFYTGEDFVFYRNIKWVRVIELTGFDYSDGYDRYAALYAPSGLSINTYNEIGDRFKVSIQHLFKSN